MKFSWRFHRSAFAKQTKSECLIDHSSIEKGMSRNCDRVSITVRSLGGAFLAKIALDVLDERGIGQTFLAGRAAETIFVEFERVFAFVALIDHEILGARGDGFSARRQRASFRKFVDETLRAVRRSILNAESSFGERLSATVAKEAVAMKGISAMTDSAFRADDRFFALGAFGRDVARVTFVAVLLQPVDGVVDEAFRSRDVVRTDRASEAVRVVAIVLVLQKIHRPHNRLTASHTSPDRHLERDAKNKKKTQIEKKLPSYLST